MSLLKNNSKNPFRNASKNIRAVLKTDKPDEDKISILQTVLDRTEFVKFDHYFYSHPSHQHRFDKDRWEVCSDFAKSSSNHLSNRASKNPWFVLMLEFIDIMLSERSSAEKVRDLQISCTYFFQDESREDWVKI